MTSPSPPRSRSSSSSPAPQATKKMSLYMFFKHGHGQINHSLFAVEIPNDPLITEIDSTPISPTLSFRLTDFPSGMHCVEFGSKFYFLGGQTINHNSNSNSNSKKPYNPHSPNVFIFDPATTTTTTTTNANVNAFDFVTPGPSMNTGKPYPMLLFVAYGKLYALSSPHKYMGLHLEYFEVFDPNTNTWSPLPPPPFDDFDLCGHAIIKNKFYILAEPFCPGAQLRLFCFHLDNNEWAPSMPLAISPNLKCNRIYIKHLMADIVEDTLYAFGHLNHSLFALAPSQHIDIDDDNGNGNGEYFKRLIHISQQGESESEGEVESMVPRAGPSGTLIHLGNKRFCYVVGSNPVLLPLPNDPEDIQYDQQTLYIDIIIFEALIDTFANHDDHTCSKAKVLHSARFVYQSGWDTEIARLSDCLLIPPV